MGNLTVRFIGICVHVRLQPLPVRHRVVLLAHHGGDIAGQPVDPHTPRMFLPLPRRIALDCVSVAGGTGDVYALSGVRIRVANPRGELTYHATYSDALPHLTRPGNVLQTNLPVVQEGAPPAAAYFDIDHGAFSACMATEGGAVGTTLQVETDGEPVLELTCFSGGDPALVTFESGTVLQIVNTAFDGKDGEHDYLINYLVCAPYPEVGERVIPGKSSVPLPNCFASGSQLPLELDFSPKCSNSNYP